MLYYQGAPICKLKNKRYLEKVLQTVIGLCTCIRVSVCVRLFLPAYARVHACVFVCMCMCERGFVCVHLCVCACVFVCLCVRACVRACVRV